MLSHAYMCFDVHLYLGILTLPPINDRGLMVNLDLSVTSRLTPTA